VRETVRIDHMKLYNIKTPMLSKSRYLAGLQCPLRLWYQCYNPELAAEVSPTQQAIFDTGHEVGELATHLYPGGVLVKEDYLHHKQAVRTTLDAMNNPNVPAIYEAAFLHDGVRVRVDILERLDNSEWNLVEVKSSTSLKDVYLPDVAIQYHVLQGVGLNIDRTGILHINNQYIYQGEELELEALFSFSEMTDQILSLQQGVPQRLAQMKAMLGKAHPPQIPPSRHCTSPYLCEFWEHCTREMPEHWVMELSGISEKRLHELAALKIRDISDIPESFPLTMLQERIKRCVINNEAYLSRELRNELSDVEYPIHFLDFETVSPAIPRYANTRPYQTIPFQWSDHILYEGKTVEQQEYLCEQDKDPRNEFALTLLHALGSKGTIFTYTTYEKGIINELAEYCPEYRDQLIATLDRFKDLCVLIRKHFYHPGFHGSFSLKAVLPALVPDMNYKTLTIQEGSQASFDYLRMLDPLIPSGEKRKIKKDLLNYCGYDTLAMVRIREELLKLFH